MPRPFPALGVVPYLATLEGVGLGCGPSSGQLPVLQSCGIPQDPGVDAIAVTVNDGNGLVLSVYAYVVAPGRSDFDDYATTFFREYVMPTLVEPNELPPFEVIRTAAQTSGKLLVGGFTFQFQENRTTRAMYVTYTGP